MNTVGFASTYSLVDILEELPLPKALNLKDIDQLANEPLDFHDVQELQDVASIIAPAIQMARLPSSLDRLQFKDPNLSPNPNIRTHHAQASPLMSIVISHYQQFQDIITVPHFNIPRYNPAPQPQPPLEHQHIPQPMPQPIPQPPQTQQTTNPIHYATQAPVYNQPVHPIAVNPPYQSPATSSYHSPVQAVTPVSSQSPYHSPVKQQSYNTAHAQPVHPSPVVPAHQTPSSVPHHVSANQMHHMPIQPPVHHQPTIPPPVYPSPAPLQPKPQRRSDVQSKGSSPEKRERRPPMVINKRANVTKFKKRPEIHIDTKGSSLEEVLEEFLVETLNEQTHEFTPKQLLHLVAITSKLKRKGLTKNVNINKLTSMMIRFSTQLQVQSELLHSECKGQTIAVDMQKFDFCCDCAVATLNVMTSSNMDSKIYLEECVEATINFINIALSIINYCSSPKKSVKHGDRNSSKLIARCSEIIALVNDLLVCRTESTLNDSLLLSTSRAALTAFFLMDSSTTSNELQLNALSVITAIFSAYKSHQTVILEELIHSIARLPTTKRNRVHYQIGSDGNETISIFSALILKLIQSLFTIRRHQITDDKSSQGESSDSSDYERILKSQYNSALRASYAFVSSFLRRCCGVDKKDDNDYRVLFETFVEDLMTCLYRPDWSSAQLVTHVLIKLLISNINPQPGKKHQQSTNQTLKLASLEHLGTICARLVKEKSTLPMYKREVKKALRAIDLSSLYMTQGNEFKSKRLRSKSLKKEMLSDSDTEEEGTENGGNENEPNDEVEFDMAEKKFLSRSDEQKFWLALLTYCQREKKISKCGRNIYCAIWLKEIERRAKSQFEANNPASENSVTASDDEESNGPQTYSSKNNNEDGRKPINGPSAEDLQADMVRDFFKLLSVSSKRSAASIDNSVNSETAADEDVTIDEATASNIIKLLDVSLSTTQKLIDASLSHIVAALSTTANTNIRSRAMKSLSHVLNDAPKECAASLLTRDDLQKAIGSSLLDQSTSVRESTVELIGRFILNSQSEDLIDKYYDMLTNRIMDSGVSVRKRVIKILRGICIAYPHYGRIPEICSIIIKRINDEGEGIRKLVSETFTQMWFKEEGNHEAIVAKVACITHVVATVWSKILAEANTNTGSESHFEWLHQLLSSLLKAKPNTDEQTNHVGARNTNDEGGEVVPPEVVNVKQTLAASTQIISVLMSEKLSNISQESTSRADCLATMTALWSFAKICPLLLTHYLDVFQSFLNVEPKSSFDLLILEKVIQIIELILPSISNPSATTLMSIETNLGKLIIRGSIRVISVSVSCLSEMIHRHTHNNQLANDMFKRFLRLIRQYRGNPSSFETANTAYFLRALYTCGLIAKHFNIDDRDILYTDLIYFADNGIRQIDLKPSECKQDQRILLRSLEGLGFMFERTPGLMLRESTSRIYRYFMNKAVDLSPDDANAAASVSVLTNLKNYLQDEVNQEIKSASSIDWSRENLKEMTSSKQEDANSTQSSVIQLYLRDILSCALSSNVDVRKAAIKLIHGVHNGGHINPLSIIPSLIALSSDDDTTIRVRADHILQEIEKKYSNFVNMKSKQGVFESFILNRGRRGFYRLEKQTSQGSTELQTDQSQSELSNNTHVNISAKLSNLYSVIATSRQQRRAFINALLRYFDIQTLSSAPNMLSSDQNENKFILSKCIDSDILMFVCDNLMFLPFTLLDEPYFLIHQVGITLSNLVSQALSQFREILQISNPDDEEVEEEKDVDELDDLPVSTLQARDLVSSLHRCILLLQCRRVIWDLYAITEQKFADYTPNESTKVTDKPTHRRNLDEQTCETLTKITETTIHFDSNPFLKSMYSEIFGLEDALECSLSRRQLRLEYKRFLQMMTLQ